MSCSRGINSWSATSSSSKLLWFIYYSANIHLSTQPNWGNIRQHQATIYILWQLRVFVSPAASLRSLVYALQLLMCVYIYVLKYVCSCVNESKLWFGHVLVMSPVRKTILSGICLPQRKISHFGSITNLCNLWNFIHCEGFGCCSSLLAWDFLSASVAYSCFNYLFPS